MKKALLAASLATLFLAVMHGGHGPAPAQAAVPQEIIGVEPAVPLPGTDPCPACVYDVANKRFYGVLDPSYTHRYPLTRMTLTLYSLTDAVLDGPISLSPSEAYGSQDMDQTAATNVSSGVARAVFSFHTDDGYDLSQGVALE